MRERKDDKDVLPVYESLPPSWLPKAHGSADLGYLGFYPPRPGQDEDLLLEANVKTGFILGHPVSAETFSGQAMINEELHSTDTLAKLEGLMNEVFIRRADHIPLIPSSTFRMPTRVTLNDAKRQAWFADLADPEVPLHKLGKSVPHGAKGHDLLDLLQANNVAIPRAVWFLRVFGANENAGLRNKPSYDPTQYSIDWANVVTSYMKKQLADIALPSAPRPGLNIKQTFKGVLADADTRERWISRFTYCLRLLRTFYSEGLVDNRTFLIWIIQQMGTCNLAQAGFVTRLADEYLDGMIGSRALSRPFVDACLNKLSEIRHTLAQDLLGDTQALLKILLQRLCLALPDAFISPRMWTTHSLIINSALTENIMDHTTNQHLEQNVHNIHELVLNNLSDITRRNEAMVFRNLPPRVLARLGSAVSDIRLLNSISNTTDLDTVTFFPTNLQDCSVFVEKLDVLLTWSVTPLQYGDHRPFAAVTLLRIWRDKAGDRASRRDFTPPDEFLQDQLFDWLDSSDDAGEVDNVRAVALLFGKLVKHELFSYTSYIQRLIARGEPGISYTEDNESRHRKFLRWIPLFKSTPSLISQRKVTLYGARARETPEDLNEKRMRKEIRDILPELFGGDAQAPLAATGELLAKCPTLITASRFEQVRTFRQWLLPILQKTIVRQEPDTTSQPILSKSYRMSVELMAHVKCFHSILDLTFCMLEYSTTIDLLTAVLEILHRFATIWTCMNVTGNITMALYAAHQLQRTRGIQSRALLALLVEFDNGRHLDANARQHIASDVSTFKLALQPMTDHPDPVPDVLPEILLLANDPALDAPSILANGLWIKYRMSSDWAWKVWDNTVASLRQVPILRSDTAGRRACALRYGIFLWHIDQHLPTSLDDEVLRWFLGPGKNEVAALNVDVWDVLTVVLLYLSVHGALKTTTILRGLVYPTWLLGAHMSPVQQGQSLEIYLYAANSLFKRLLLQDDGSSEIMPPTDLLDVQCIRARRQDVYREPHFSLLVASIPHLVAVEQNIHIHEELRDETRRIRYALCEDREFRQATFRNLDTIREAFEHSLQFNDDESEGLSKHIIAALRMVLCESLDDIELSGWPDISSLLSPWKLGVTAMQLQFSLRQMGRALSQESTYPAASAGLDQLTSMVFHHSMTSEEAYFVAELARGVDSAVAGKFINNGLKCIANILSDASTTISNLTERIQRAGELLRVLIYIAKPLQQTTPQLPTLDPEIQHELFDALCIQSLKLETLLAEIDATEEVLPQVTQSAILLARLLQFDLGFRCTWTSRAREAGINLSSTIFRLALMYGAGDKSDPVAYPLLIDTLYYLIDEIPSDSKVVAFDPFRNYPDMSLSDIPADLPPEYRFQIQSLLHYLPPTASVSNLSTAYRNSMGNLVHGPPVLSRPWEWVENLGEPTNLDPKEEEREREERQRLKVQYLVKNSGSLSLDTFGARLTGDGILRNTGKCDDVRTEGNIRSFEDGLSAESVFKRDWRETRFELEVLPAINAGRKKSEMDQGVGGGSSSYTGHERAEKRSTPRASPASSVLSRSSAHGSAVSLRRSPGQASLNWQSNSTVSETVDMDNMATASSAKKSPSKRKVANVSDEEVEIVEGPAPSRTAKKPKVKTSAKARVKKR